MFKIINFMTTDTGEKIQIVTYADCFENVIHKVNYDLQSFWNSMVKELKFEISETDEVQKDGTLKLFRENGKVDIIYDGLKIVNKESLREVKEGFSFPLVIKGEKNEHARL